MATEREEFSIEELTRKIEICDGTRGVVEISERVSACSWLLETGLLTNEEAVCMLANRAEAWEEAGEYARAIEDYTAVIQLDPNDHDACFMLSWIYAVTGGHEQRNGLMAVRLAKRAVALHDVAYTRWGLAAAYAAAGQFEAAVRQQKKANWMALEEGYYSGPSMEMQEERLRLFESGKPIRAD